MKRGIGITLVIIAIGVLWYLFFKPQDYRINVEVNSIPGTINQSLKLWSTNLGTNSKITQNKDFNHLTQTIQVSADSTDQLEWFIESLNDSTSRIKVDVTDLQHSLGNKIQIPFSDTDFEKRSRKTVRNFIEKLREHEKSFQITLVGNEELLSTSCACIAIESSQYEKAGEMMKGFPLLNTVFAQNEIQLNGLPFIKINDWNMLENRISYDFCYPIIQKDDMPFIKGVSYKSFEGGKALKAIYNGNYISSDRAWYALLDYAKKENIEVEPKPIEFFFNNPNMGGDELSWKTEVFLPLKN
ncbi:GyrI-like domain-containing protein [Maribacter sp. 2210JD10-5]|uniref:GyrI-like domain-containing protein n=1 Tax=Maribacter sp. 2210JD10-5 TaxID=3386272 RepID=UPI0039BD0417